jgi:hypothetical protein
MKFQRGLKLVTICLAAAGACSPEAVPRAGLERPAIDLTTPQGRLAALIEANVIATHAYQVKLAMESGRGDRDCYSGAELQVPDLDAIVTGQESLLHADVSAILGWIEGEGTSFDPSESLLPILRTHLPLSEALPVNVLTADLMARTSRPMLEVRSLANLYQTCLEVDRDGTLLWDLYHFYIGLDLPVYDGQFGLPGDDDDFYRTGERLQSRTCQSPFDTDAAAWRIAGRKVWNWGEKKLHHRDRFTVAKELLREPAVRGGLVRMKSMPPQKVAVIGHSFTMDSHWSSPSSFASMVDAIFQLENPAVRTRQWFGGGLTASRARRQFYEEALAWSPDQVLFAVAIRSPEDLAALKEMTAGFAASGALIHVFDSLMDPSEDEGLNQFGPEQELEWGFRVIPVRETLRNSPEKGKFLCLDGIHMTEPYHRLMAQVWLEALIRGGSQAAGASH